MSAVPVFLYHSVADDPPSWIAPFTVSPRAFAEQLDRIADSGLTVVPLHRLVAALHGGPRLPPHAAVLTFDDGFEDFFWTVAPQLADRGLPATLFVTTGAVHPPGGAPEGSLLPPAPMLTWRQITNLDVLGGVEIGGHSRTHAQLDTLSWGALDAEIGYCKRQLEEVLGHGVDSFAYPHGYSSAVVRRRLREYGWSSGCAVRDAFSSAADDPLRIARLTVRADTAPEVFHRWTLGQGARVAPYPEPVRTRAWRGYRRLRAGLGRPVGGPAGA
ncbi:polysaccharide deacetylase family protein [Kitasatospora sp. NPDC057904]|uniref:polysaccharide deacetylase family protein n=1 Tax=unclassified Kitasatospora TaxID=2633591 RepID=UPI0036DCC8D8